MSNKTGVRVCALACVAVGALAWFGIAKSDVGRICAQANDVYTETVEPHLQELGNAANGLAMTMVNYPACNESMTALRTARNSLADASGASAQGQAYTGLKEAFPQAYADICAQDLSDTEKRNVSAYDSSFQTQVNAIEASSYNTLAQEAREKLSGGLGRALAGDSLPEVFE